jgi:hypothetical protein
MRFLSKSVAKSHPNIQGSLHNAFNRDLRAADRKGA